MMRYCIIACSLVLLGCTHIGHSVSSEQELQALEEQLWQAVKNDDTRTAERLLREGVDPNVKQLGHLGKPKTPLMHAVKNFNNKMARLLLERGAQPLTPLELTDLERELYGAAQQADIVAKRQRVMDDVSQWLRGQDTKAGVVITPDLEKLIHQYLGTPEKELPGKAIKDLFPRKSAHNREKKRRRLN